MQVYILHLSQGSYSDRSDWIGGVYDSVEAVLADPGNKRYKLVKSDRYPSAWYGEDRTDNEYEPIYATIAAYDVLTGTMFAPS